MYNNSAGGECVTHLSHLLNKPMPGVKGIVNANAAVMKP